MLKALRRLMRCKEGACGGVSLLQADPGGKLPSRVKNGKPVSKADRRYHPKPKKVRGFAEGGEVENVKDADPAPGAGDADRADVNSTYANARLTMGEKASTEVATEKAKQ